MLRFPAILLGAALLSGCGFHVQGAVTVPESMDKTYIDAVDVYSPFYQEMQRRLQAAGVDVVDTEDAATAVFSIVFEETGQRVLSVSARNTPAEFEVFYTVAYALAANGESLLPQQDLTLVRAYVYDETLVLGKAEEEELLRRAIVDDMVRIVLKQFATL